MSRKKSSTMIDKTLEETVADELLLVERFNNGIYRWEPIEYDDGTIHQCLVGSIPDPNGATTIDLNERPEHTYLWSYADSQFKIARVADGLNVPGNLVASVVYDRSTGLYTAGQIDTHPYQVLSGQTFKSIKRVEMLFGHYLYTATEGQAQ